MRRPVMPRIALLCLLLPPLAVMAPGCRGGGPDQRTDEPQAGEEQPVTGEQPPIAGQPQAAEDAPVDAAEQPSVGREQAIGVARRQVLFEPETALAELAADADPPVWRVTLRGRRPGGSLFAFEEATVTVDARTGDVLDIDGR